MAAKGLPPVVCVVASCSGTGKTTFMEKLIRHLKLAGLKVCAVKHHHGKLDFDTPGKDTWRHAKAGADTVILATPQGLGIVKRCPELSLDDIRLLAGDADIILAEGYKKLAGVPKIEVYRREVSGPGGLVTLPGDLLALVADSPADIEGDLPVFDLEDAAGVARHVISIFFAGKYQGNYLAGNQTGKV